MKLKIYAVKDVRTEAFLKPFFVQNFAVMERAIMDARNDENNTLSVHPEDYQVYELGEYDDNTGEISPVPPKFLFNVNNVQEND